MHTVRNRLASRPPVAVPFAATPNAPNHAALRHDMATIQRGSMAVPLVIPDESGLIEPRRQKRRNPKGKKARKAAARLAAIREAPAPEPASGEVAATPRRAKAAARKGKGKGKGKAHAAIARHEVVRPEQLPAIPAANPVVGTYSPPGRKNAAHPASALSLPVCHEPLVVAPVRLAGPDAEPARKPEPAPEPALAALPRSQALVPVRRQGLIDVIAFLLRDSGRRLARWSARRHKTREEQAALRRAEAQQINLQRELEALDALRRAKV